MQKYNKTIVAVVAVILTGLNMIYGQNDIVQMVIAVATMLGVYQIPNKGL